jgi:N-acetylneuraminic acid mutarotase
MNEMHMFDFSQFLANPTNSDNHVIVKKIDISENVPSTRWGHASATYNGKLYIIGGRNDQDINDVYEFDPNRRKWREVETADPKPKPRRRHSAIFVSGSLILFGGFDGNFYNDLHVLDF